MKLTIALVLSIAAFAHLAAGQEAAAKNPFPAAMESFQIPSDGVGLNALMYVAEGQGPHPVVVLLHGFPGNERNLDLAQDIRRAGWNVLYFNYRGSWGTKGDFSFSNGIADVAAAITYLRRPESVKSLRVDSKRVVLIGHSMGGFMAVQAAAADPTVTAAGLISAADFGSPVPTPRTKESDEAFIPRLAERLSRSGLAPLAGCTAEGLAREIVENSAEWKFAARADALRSRPVFVFTSDDGLASMGDTFASALKKAGSSRVTTQHFTTDHSYSDKRLELSAAVRSWLKDLAAK
mgnify:FL=1